jgi:flagellar protein FlaF
VYLSQRAHDTYATSTAPIRSSRSIEYEVLSKTSHRLRNAARARATNFSEFVEAVSENRQLWTLLATDIAKSGNSLPKELRARLFWLAEFTEAESRKLLRGGGDVGILLEINAAVLRGLRGQDLEE